MKQAMPSPWPGLTIGGKSLVERLREEHPTPYKILKEAADRIEQLERQITHLEDRLIELGEE